MNPEHRRANEAACAKKTASGNVFAGRRAAERAASNLRHNRQNAVGALHAYHCVCGKWHVGNSSSDMDWPKKTKPHSRKARRKVDWTPESPDGEES